ncbi:MAG: hypothetical protein ACOYOH_24045, partial [Paracraurococcus sp.]
VWQDRSLSPVIIYRNGKCKFANWFRLRKLDTLTTCLVVTSARSPVPLECPTMIDLNVQTGRGKIYWIKPTFMDLAAGEADLFLPRIFSNVVGHILTPPPGI